MKKLIIASIAAAVGLAVNAAAVDWQFQITGATTEDAYNSANYSVYLVDKAAWDAATITAAIFSDSDVVLDSTTFGSPSGKSSKSYLTISSGTDKGARRVTIDSLAENDYLDVYYVVLNTSSDPSTYTKVADSLKGVGDTAETTIGSAWDNTKASLSWTPVSGSSPVPEPTSGLLLVLGMAGLALRRCRRS